MKATKAAPTKLGCGLAGVAIGAIATGATVFLTPVADDAWQQFKAFRYEIVEPAQSTDISSSQGFTTRGMAYNLPSGGLLWVLDRDSDGFYVAEPAHFYGNEWSATSAPVGDPSDGLPFDIQFVLVLATPDCSDSLRNAPDSFLRKLPAGCRVLETRFLRVTRR